MIMGHHTRNSPHLHSWLPLAAGPSGADHFHPLEAVQSVILRLLQAVHSLAKLLSATRAAQYSNRPPLTVPVRDYCFTQYLLARPFFNLIN